MTDDAWNEAFARKVAARQAEQGARFAADPRDAATVFAEVVASMGPDAGPWFAKWVRDRIGERVPTRAELAVLLEIVLASDEEEEEHERQVAYERIMADLNLGHAREARRQLHAEWSAIDRDFTAAELFGELVRRGALSREQAKREVAFLETWAAAQKRAEGSPDA